MIKLFPRKPEQLALCLLAVDNEPAVEDMAVPFNVGQQQAAALLHQNKPQDAKVVLQTALNTIVIDDIIFPLPLVRAEAALEDARTLLEKKKGAQPASAREGTGLRHR